MRYLYLLLFVLCSCTSAKELSVYSINLDNANSEDVLFKDYHSVALETNPDCLISKIKKIDVVADTISILDKDRILFFSMDGKYLSKIDKRGRGAEEFAKIDDYAIQHSLVYILTRATKTISVYTPKGQFLRKSSLDDWYAHLAFCGEDTLALSSENSNNTNRNFMLLNTQTMKQTGTYGDFDKNESMLFGTFSPFCGKYRRGLYVINPFDYSVYQLSGKGMHPYCSFDFLKHNLPDNFQSLPYYDVYKKTMNTSVVRHLGMYSEIDGVKYLTLRMFSSQGGISCYVCKIKENGGTEVVKVGDKFTHNFPYFSMPLATYRDCYVNAMSADAVLDIEKQHQLDRFKKQGLKKEDNFVLFFHRLRDK